jgi:hypothetical protein
MSRTPAAYLPLLNDWDCDVSGGHWGLIRELVTEFAADTVCDAALEWCQSTDNATWATGLDVLGYLTNEEQGLLVTLLHQVLLAAASDDVDVRWSAAVALHHKRDERVLSLLVGLFGDSDSSVRWQAVYGLPGRRDLPPGHPVVHALLRAMEDESDSVRDWATFALGTQTDVDSALVRDAFAHHLDDDGCDTAAEAARGLARRKDRRVYPVLVQRLADPDVDDTYVEAAAELADPRLLPLLEALRDGGWADEASVPDYLDAAILACSTATVRCRAPRRLRPQVTVTADAKVAGSAGTGCRTRLRTSSQPGSGPWRSA